MPTPKSSRIAWLRDSELSEIASDTPKGDGPTPKVMRARGNTVKSTGKGGADAETVALLSEMRADLKALRAHFVKD